MVGTALDLVGVSWWRLELFGAGLVLVSVGFGIGWCWFGVGRCCLVLVGLGWCWFGAALVLVGAGLVLV